MQPKNIVNDIQASIMRQLYFNDGLRFAELNVLDSSSDHFSYHLRQLTKHGIIEKTENVYRLTVIGRSRAIMLYPDQSTFIQQGFLGIRLVIRGQRDENQLILMQKRLAVPYKGKYTTPGGRILFGDDILSSARRILQTQTGLTGEITLRGMHHLKDVYQQNIVQDKYFFVCEVVNPHGELLAEGPSGKNTWLAYQDLRVSQQLVHGCLDIVDQAIGEPIGFSEKTYVVDKY